MQTFSDIIEPGMVYVDKTDLVYRMVKKYKYVFLCRPHCFGKSLLSIMLNAYFAGQADLFKGLAIENQKRNWTAHPIQFVASPTLKSAKCGRCS